MRPCARIANQPGRDTDVPTGYQVARENFIDERLLGLTFDMYQ